MARQVSNEEDEAFRLEYVRCFGAEPTEGVCRALGEFPDVGSCIGWLRNVHDLSWSLFGEYYKEPKRCQPKATPLWIESLQTANAQRDYEGGMDQE